ncbi:MAG: hypothetical protein HW386_2600, partial [Gammaproteobacteria bacterium]|nr:hypothetical protein [Gammaproteobacteria bacterium]
MLQKPVRPGYEILPVRAVAMPTVMLPPGELAIEQP